MTVAELYEIAKARNCENLPLYLSYMGKDSENDYKNFLYLNDIIILENDKVEIAIDNF